MCVMCAVCVACVCVCVCLCVCVCVFVCVCVCASVLLSCVYLRRHNSTGMKMWTKAGVVVFASLCLWVCRCV